MITIKLTTECGNSWVTKINASMREAEEYYLGKTFDAGKVIRIEHICHCGKSGSGYFVGNVFKCVECAHKEPWYLDMVSQPLDELNERQEAILDARERENELWEQINC